MNDWRNLALLSLGSFFMTIAEGGVGILYPPYLQHLGFPMALLGGLIALDGVGRLASRLPSGLAYTASRARLLSAAALLMLFVCTTLIPWARDSWELSLLILCRAAGYGVATTIIMALLMELKFTTMNAGSIMGWFNSAFALGHAVGTLVAGYLADRFGYPAAFTTLGFLPALSFFFILPVSPAATPNVPLPPSISGAVRLGRVRHRWKEFKGLGLSVFIATLLAFYLNVITDILSTLFPLFALGLGISLTSIGAIRGVTGVFGILARFFSGVIFSVLDYRKVNYVVVAVLGLSVMLIPSQGTVAAFGVSYSFYSISRGLLRVSSGAMVMSEFEGKRQGKGLASGLYHAGLDLGVLLGPALAGFSAQLFGIPATLRLLPLFFLGLIYALLLFSGQRRVARARAEGVPEEKRA